MILRRAGVRYECPMTMNMADDVRDVRPKFDRGRSKSIDHDRDDRGGFDDVRMARKLVEVRIWTDRRYRDVVRGRSRKIEVDRGAREISQARYRGSRSIGALYRLDIRNAKNTGIFPEYYVRGGRIILPWTEILTVLSQTCEGREYEMKGNV
jgi:hypothetical protein